MSKGTFSGLLVCIYSMSDRAALHENDGMMTILACHSG